MHAQQHCIAICLGSVRCSRPVSPPSCGIAPGGPRPCRASQPFSPRCCSCIRSLSSLPSAWCFSVRDIVFPCALVGPLFPPPPAPCHLYVPFLCVHPSCCFFFFVSVLALLAAPARPACALCSSSCYPGPAALHPLSRLSSLPFSFSLSTLPARLPSPIRAALSLACATRVPYPCPSPSPLPFPLGAPSVPASHPILAAWRPV